MKVYRSGYHEYHACIFEYEVARSTKEFYITKSGKRIAKNACSLSFDDAIQAWVDARGQRISELEWQINQERDAIAHLWSLGDALCASDAFSAPECSRTHKCIPSPEECAKCEVRR